MIAAREKSLWQDFDEADAHNTSLEQGKTEDWIGKGGGGVRLLSLWNRCDTSLRITPDLIKLRSNRLSKTTQKLCVCMYINRYIYRFRR